MSLQNFRRMIWLLVWMCDPERVRCSSKRLGQRVGQGWAALEGSKLGHLGRANGTEGTSRTGRPR